MGAGGQGCPGGEEGSTSVASAGHGWHTGADLRASLGQRGELSRARGTPCCLAKPRVLWGIEKGDAANVLPSPNAPQASAKARQVIGASFGPVEALSFDSDCICQNCVTF